MELTGKALSIANRYKKGYVTDAQLNRYLELGSITQEEYEEIYNSKHNVQND